MYICIYIAYDSYAGVIWRNLTQAHIEHSARLDNRPQLVTRRPPHNISGDQNLYTVFNVNFVE